MIDLQDFITGRMRLVAWLTMVALVVLTGCSRPGTAATKALTKGDAIETAAAVNIAKVKTADISKEVEVTGSLVALNDVVLGAKLAGKLASVNLHEGDAVSAGQIVAVMDTTDLMAQVQQQEANVRAGVTREEQARIALAQTRNALQSAKTTLNWTDETTKVAVESAKSGLQTAKERLAVVRQGARKQERQQAEEQVKAAKSNYDKADSDYKRYRDLLKEQAVSQSQFDEKLAARDAAQAAYNGAKLALSLIQEGARPEDIRTAELAVSTAQEVLNRATADRANVQLRAQDVHSAEVGVKSAAAGVQTAVATTAQSRAALRIAQDALNNAYVKSTVTGVVAERKAEPGQQLGAGGAIMRVVDPRSVYFQAVIAESQYGDVRLSMTARVTIDALPGRVFTGRITRILPIASSGARNFTLRIDIPPDVRLRPQMFARGNILIDTHRAATLVPKDAVIFDPSSRSARVFVTDGKVATDRPIKTGYVNPDYVEAVSGLQPDDKVIVSGQSALQSGDRVNVQ